jgi:hopanoid biosynthesis associated protein HpnK
MVAGPAAGDAVARARRLPSLRIGLHLVLVDGPPLLPPERIPDLVDARARLRSDVASAGVSMFLRPGVRRQLAAEIEAQFRAFKATGLALDHVNAHHHFHLHPTVNAQMLAIGERYGMRAVRVPWEAKRLLAGIDPRTPRHRGHWLEAPWVAVLRNRVRRRGLTAADWVFGLAWSGAMTEARLAGVLRQLPDGLTEIYSHPATSAAFPGAASGYRYADELAALTAPGLKELLRATGAKSGGYGDFLRR